MTTPNQSLERVDLQLACKLYNAGYAAGHNDTVEACYTDILPVDQGSYHLEVVSEIVLEIYE